LLCDDAGEKINILLCDDAGEKINILLRDDAGENLPGHKLLKFMSYQIIFFYANFKVL
jgi:hypothetical protein